MHLNTVFLVSTIVLIVVCGLDLSSHVSAQGSKVLKKRDGIEGDAYISGPIKTIRIKRNDARPVHKPSDPSGPSPPSNITTSDNTPPFKTKN